MKSFAILSLAAALALVVPSVTVSTHAMAAQAKPKATKAHAGKPVRKPAPMAPRVVEEDQSFLYSGPGPSKGAPDYVTSGSRNFNQPWFMTNQDRIGSW